MMNTNDEHLDHAHDNLGHKEARRDQLEIVGDTGVTPPLKIKECRLWAVAASWLYRAKGRQRSAPWVWESNV